MKIETPLTAFAVTFIESGTLLTCEEFIIATDEQAAIDYLSRTREVDRVVSVGDSFAR